MNRGTSFRTASPLSTYSPEKRPRRWPQVANRSDPLLASHQVPLTVRSDNSQYSESVARSPPNFPRAYTRVLTPMPAASFNPQSNIAQTQRAPPSPPPLFYDYSEQFQQEVDYNRPLAHNIPQTVYGNDEGFARNLYTRSKDRAIDYTAPVGSGITARQINRSGRSGQAEHTVTNELSQLIHNEDAGRLARNCVDTTVNDRKANTTIVLGRSSPKGSVPDLESIKPFESKLQPPPKGLRNPAVHELLSSYKLNPEILRAASEPAAGDTNDVPYHRRSLPGSSVSSLKSAQASSNYKKSEAQPDVSDTPPVRRSVCADHDLLKPEADASKFSFESERAYFERFSNQSAHGTASSFRRQTSPRGASRDVTQNKHSEIHAPVPRRSLSSPSNRDRFSSILSIDEGLDGLDEVAATLEGDAGLSLPIGPTNIRRSLSIRGKSGSSHPIIASLHSSPKLNGLANATNDIIGVAQEVQTSDAVTGLPILQAHEDDAEATVRELQAADSYSLKGHTVSKKRKPLLVQLRSEPPLNATDVKQGGVASSTPPVSLRTMKELPPLPRSSVISVTPSHGQNVKQLPFSFTALRHEDKDETDSVTELGKLAASYLDHLDRVGTETPASPQRNTLKARPDGSASPTRPSSRPWNSEANYPWNDQMQQPETARPKRLFSDNDRNVSTKAPRFWLKLRRSSTSTTGASRTTKPRPSNESSVPKQISTVSVASDAHGEVVPIADVRLQHQRFSTSSGTFQDTPFGGKPRPNPPIISYPGQSNTSRATPTPLNTRFAESFDLQAHNFAYQTSPSITLAPPSPGLNFEARSFFSDDSSQMRPKGSLRKRLSQFKATVTRASTTDDARGGDRALNSSAAGKPFTL